MPPRERIRLWVAESGPVPEGWTHLAIGIEQAYAMLRSYPQEVEIVSLPRLMPGVRDLTWWLTGGRALRELPGSTVIEVRP